MNPEFFTRWRAFIRTALIVVLGLASEGVLAIDSLGSPVHDEPYLLPTSIKIGNSSPTPLSGDLSIPVVPYGKSLEIDFVRQPATFETAVPAGIRYRLTPESPWVMVKESPRLLFAHLPPGETTLEIQAFADAKSFAPSQFLKFTVATPWWRSVFAYATYLLILFALLAALAHWLRTREKLKETLLTLSVFENAVEGLCVLSEDWRVLRINPAMQAMLNWTIGEDIRPYFEKSDALLPVIQDQVPKLWHAEAKLNDGRNGALIAEVHLSQLSAASGENLRLLEIKDITKRKQAELALTTAKETLETEAELRSRALEKAKAQAASAIRAKVIFLLNMSNEIASSLNTIVSFTQLLRRGGDNFTPMQIDKLARIDSASSHLLSTINDAFDLSKIEAGILQLEMQSFDCRQLLNKIAVVAQELATSKGLDFFVEIDPSLRWLRGDPSRLSKMLMVYLDNALKFTETGGITMRIRTEKKQGTCVLVRFEVSDTGVGLSPAQQSRLFTAFEEADNSLDGKHGSAGLALTITHHLAGMMGGEVGVDSHLGTGSTFWFSAALDDLPETIELLDKASTATLPQATASADHVSELQARIPSGFKEKHLLLVEDNKFTRQIAEDTLTDFGLHVDLAENGQEALDKVRNNRYDLVLMDIQMPQMDGLEATSLIRKIPGKASLPIVAMTAGVMQEDRENCIAVGMSDFIGKPFEPDELITILERWLLSPASNDAQHVESNSLPGDCLPAAIPGIDLALGLRRFMGKRERYRHFIERFACERAGAAQAVAKNLKQHGDIQEAIRILHTTKGIAGQIGAENLRSKAENLETALHTDATDPAVDHLWQAFNNELSALCNAIEQHLPPPPATEPSPPLPAAAAQAVFRQFVEMLKNDEAKSLNLLNDYSATFIRDLSPSVYNELRKAVEHFDFDTALLVLREKAADTMPATIRID